MQIQIELDEELLRKAIMHVAKDAFVAPSYSSGNGGYGYQVIQQQVKDHVLTLDFSPLIAAEVKLQMADVVRDVVRFQLREEVKVQAKRMRLNGEWLGE